LHYSDYQKVNVGCFLELHEQVQRKESHHGVFTRADLVLAILQVSFLELGIVRRHKHLSTLSVIFTNLKQAITQIELT